MKSFFAFLVTLLLASNAAMALDVPQSNVKSLSTEESERDLFLFNNQRRCERRSKVCEATVGVSSLPFTKWLKFIEPLTGDNGGLLQSFKLIIQLATGIDISDILNKLTGSANRFDLSQLVDTVKLMLSQATSVFTAIRSGNKFEAVSLIFDLLTKTSSIFGTATNGVTNLIEAINDLVADVLTSTRDSIDSARSMVDDVFESVTEFISGFYTSILGLLGKDVSASDADSCTSRLLTCEYNRLIISTVPKLMSLSFLAAGQE